MNYVRKLEELNIFLSGEMINEQRVFVNDE